MRWRPPVPGQKVGPFPGTRPADAAAPPRDDAPAAPGAAGATGAVDELRSASHDAEPSGARDTVDESAHPRRKDAIGAAGRTAPAGDTDVAEVSDADGPATAPAHEAEPTPVTQPTHATETASDATSAGDEGRATDARSETSER